MSYVYDSIIVVTFGRLDPRWCLDKKFLEEFFIIHFS